MAGKGLTFDKVIHAALVLVEEKGYDNFSVRELAAKLQVKPASLYNHIENIEQIKAQVAMRAADKMNKTLQSAVRGKRRSRAFINGTNAFIAFARENPQLYTALMRMPTNNDETVVRAAFESFEPLRKVIKSYGASTVYTIHFVRRLRSAMHGYIELTAAGFMQRANLPMEDTFRITQLSFLKELQRAANYEKRRKANEEISTLH